MAVFFPSYLYDNLRFPQRIYFFARSVDIVKAQVFDFPFSMTFYSHVNKAFTAKSFLASKENIYQSDSIQVVCIWFELGRTFCQKCHYLCYVLEVSTTQLKYRYMRIMDNCKYKNSFLEETNRTQRSGLLCTTLIDSFVRLCTALNLPSAPTRLWFAINELRLSMQNRSYFSILCL